jgi:hypothetical protein
MLEMQEQFPAQIKQFVSFRRIFTWIPDNGCAISGMTGKVVTLLSSAPGMTRKAVVSYYCTTLENSYTI